MDYIIVVLAAIGGGLFVFLVFHKSILSSLEQSFKQSERVESEADMELFANVVEAIELERKRIAADIHDDLATTLSSLYLDLEMVSHEAGSLSVESEKKLVEMRKKISAIVDSLRRIIYAMLPESLERNDLLTALRELCNRFDRIKGTTITCISVGEPIALNDQVKLNLFRIVQELLNNSMKHSNAWHINVQLLWSENGLKLVVKDDGSGKVHVNTGRGRYGVNGIRLRARMIGASAEFKNSSKGMEFELILASKDLTKQR